MIELKNGKGTIEKRIPAMMRMFAKHGIDITITRGYGSGDTVTKIASGAYDIGFADLGAAVDIIEL